MSFVLTRKEKRYFSPPLMTGAPCSRRAPSAVQPPPHSGLQINLLMGDTFRPLLKEVFFLTFSGLTYRLEQSSVGIFLEGINSLKVKERIH